MHIRIEYQPVALDYAVFLRVDGDCFPDEPATDEGSFQTFLGQDFWAAWEGEALAGYCSAYSKPNLFWIRRIGVASSHRRQGIGSDLMSQAMMRCRELGLREAMLYVLDDNTAALRLYEEFDFERAETTYQYIWESPMQSQLTSEGPGPVVQALPVDEASEANMPELPGQWADFRSMHQPPGQYALLFYNEMGETIGYCRLSPGFPGCFPFSVKNPQKNLPGALRALKKYLRPDKDHLKLTLDEARLAEACNALGLQLNYKLFRMVRSF